MIYDVFANGRVCRIEAHAPNRAARKATTLVGVESGYVFVSKEGSDTWTKYAVLGRRYVLPMGRIEVAEYD